MFAAHKTRFTIWRTGLAAAFVLGALACADSTGTGGTDSTILNGIFVSDSVSGSISVTISSASLSIVAPPNASVADAAVSVNVAGSIKVTGGSTITISGTYDTGTHTITVTGGGFSFTGTFASGILSGTFTVGGASGNFTTASTGSGATVTTYCGTYAGTSNSDAGTFDLTVNSTAGTAHGFARGPGQKPVQLDGTVSGSTISLTTQEIGGNNGPGTATATISGSSISGNYTGGGTDHNTGTFTGSVCTAS